jgi:hypothetical protein
LCQVTYPRAKFVLGCLSWARFVLTHNAKANVDTSMVLSNIKNRDIARERKNRSIGWPKYKNLKLRKEEK